MPGLAEQGRGLVHDPGRHADEIVLSPAGDFDELAARDASAGQPGQRERRRALQAGRRGQARAYGQVGVDLDGGAWNGYPASRNAQATPAG